MTPALKIWRNAVVTSQSASQLAMCLNMLYDCVAWEKSIMKVVSKWDGFDGVHACLTFDKDEEALGVAKGVGLCVIECMISPSSLRKSDSLY